MSDFNLTHPAADGWTNPAHLNTQFSLGKNIISPTVMIETLVSFFTMLHERAVCLSVQWLIEIVDRWAACAFLLAFMAPQNFDTNPSCFFLHQCHIIEETVTTDLCFQLCYEM